MRKVLRVFVSLILVFIFIFIFSCVKSSSVPDAVEVPTIDTLSLGTDYVDITADIKVLTFRTDILDKLNSYAIAFHEMYPNITVTYEGVTDYESSTLVYLTSGIDWGDIMMIPVGLEKDVVGDYFLSLGKSDILSSIYNFTYAWTYGGNVYGLASTGNANGMVYNKKVFSDAGIESVPKTPLDFNSALKAIKNNTEAIPLYTNYADKWPLSCWDAYIGINATGSEKYMNQILVHQSSPFSDHNDNTNPYAVYKILYDAVADGLTEDDYATTSEALCYSLINEGEIGCLAFSSWAVVQAMNAGDNAEDIGFMPFPIFIDGKQYVSINGDYSYGINKNSTFDEQIASMLYIKWLIHNSGYDFSEGGLSVLIGGPNPDFYDSLEECVCVEDAPSLDGEETFLGLLNSESGLLINSNGYQKVQDIVEHAYAKDKTFDEIMAEWNQKWNNAQIRYGIETY